MIKLLLISILWLSNIDDVCDAFDISSVLLVALSLKAC